MNNKKGSIDIEKIKEMLFDDENYIKEFAKAGISSFKEFAEDYEKYLMARDERNFRKAGHKIKPVAQMIGMDEIIDEYEHAKDLLHKERPEEELVESVERVHALVEKVLKQLAELS